MNYRAMPALAQRGLCPVALLVLLGALTATVLETRAAAVAPPDAVTSGVFPSATAAGDSSAPVLTSDGRFVVFVSAAENLVAHDHNGAVDVFWRDRQEGHTILVSVTADGQRSANALSTAPGISADGRFVVFQSRATDLVATATNGVDNIFLRDLVAGTTSLISVNTNGTAGNYPSLNPQITPDGRWVVYESQASDLVAHDENRASDVFVRDLVAGRTILVSATAADTGTGTGYASNPSITPDGRYVVFESVAANLAGNDGNSTSDVFRRDLAAGTTMLVSADRGGLAPSNCQNAVVSADGRYVAFEGATANLNDIYLRDLQTGTPTLVSSSSEFDASTNAPSRPVISRDGRWVAFQTGSTVRRRVSVYGQVYVWDASTGDLALVSVGADGASPGAGVSYGPNLSADNRRVTFLSNATNLVADATNGTVQVYQRDLVAKRTLLVARDREGRENDRDCLSLSASDDGRWIAFECLADGLVPDDQNGAYDIFVRDLDVETTELISPAAIGLVSTTPPGPSALAPGALSADGRFVAFASLAARLVPNDTNGITDVFVRDLKNATIVLASGNTNGVSGNGVSRRPSLSADGRFVAFESQATDLTGGVIDRKGNVFLRDLWSNTTTLVSATAAGRSANGASRNPIISPDGSRVAFESLAKDLVPNHSDNYADVFLYDRAAGTVVLASVRTGGLPPSGDARDPLLTDDGRFVVFVNTATTPQLFARDLMLSQTFQISVNSRTLRNRIGPGAQASSRDSRFVVYTGGTNVYRFDLIARTNGLIRPGVGTPSLDAIGRFVAFEKPLFTPSAPAVRTNTAIAVWDTEQRTETLVSANAANTATGAGPSRAPVLSPDARFVVFVSQANDLASDDPSPASDVFARDLVLGRTHLLSQHQYPFERARHISANPQFGPDGRTVVFQSFAADLASADYNAASDLFLVRINVEDQDQDGLDDDWEMAYFETLARDGTRDFDDDGASDRAEFRAGTDPTDQGSVLRALTVTSLTEGQTTVYWSATPGRTYRVQARSEVGDPKWIDLPGTVLASADQAAFLDTSAAESGRRFYRVVLVAP